MGSVVSNYSAFMFGTPQQEVAYAASLLRDAAHDLHRRGGRMPLDCAEFRLALLDCFSSKLQAKQALDNIVNLILYMV